MFFLENVKNLYSHDRGKTFSIIKQSLVDRGYHISYKILNSSEYGNIPQNRERIYIVAFKEKQMYDRFTFPPPKRLNKMINEFLDKEVDKRYYYCNSKYYPMLKATITKMDTVYQLRRVYVRENKNKLCPTLTANMGTGGHIIMMYLDYKDIRKLTPRECARFQGFDDTFVLSDELSNATLYKQIGNSVTVPVVEAIVNQIKKAFNI